MLTFVVGMPASRPWPPVLRTDDGLVRIARLLHEYHDAVATFVPSPTARWRSGLAEFEVGQIVSHGDLGPWNSIWCDEQMVGLIDWEFAEPRWPIEDVAEVAWYFVPLQGPRVWREAGFAAPPEFSRRLAVLCRAYGHFSVTDVVDALLERQQLERQRTIDLGGAGVPPWDAFLVRGDVEQFDQEHSWLTRVRQELIAGGDTS